MLKFTESYKMAKNLGSPEDIINRHIFKTAFALICNAFAILEYGVLYK